MTHQPSRRYRALVSPSLPLKLVLKQLRRMPGLTSGRLHLLERQLHIRERHLRAALNDLHKAHDSLRAVRALLRQAGAQPCPCDVLHITLEPAQHWLQSGLSALATRH
ncbi:hypothetical protein [Chromobacterium sp. LK1]|nr:hypothetical protein [Chromobacterium sp. LK1]